MSSTPLSLPEAAPPFPRRCTSADRMMWITPERVFYAGLLGQPALHTKGSLVAYVALEGPLRIRVDGGDWQPAGVAVVPPWVPYQVACEGRHVIVLVVEPETVELAALPAVLRGRGPVDAPAFADHVRRCHGALLRAAEAAPLQPDDFDRLFFGGPLPARPLDARVAAVLERLRQDPAAPLTAEDAARQAGLSVSRFLHRFKEETGVPFRNLRAWKRARSLLHHVQADGNLVDVALDIGYPDSTHFSHSIRQTYGLKPRDIVAGSRKLRIIGGEPPALRA